MIAIDVYVQALGSQMSIGKVGELVVHSKAFFCALAAKDVGQVHRKWVPL
jgi:hypothetical protein